MHKTLCNIFRGGGGGCPLAHACGRPCSLLVLSCKAGRFSNLSFEVVVDDVFFLFISELCFCLSFFWQSKGPPIIVRFHDRSSNTASNDGSVLCQPKVISSFNIITARHSWRGMTWWRSCDEVRLVIKSHGGIIVRQLCYHRTSYHPKWPPLIYYKCHLTPEIVEFSHMEYFWTVSMISKHIERSRSFFLSVVF